MNNQEMAKVLAEKVMGWHVARGSETYPGQGYIEGDYWFDSADNQRWSVDSCGEFQGEDDRVYSPATNIAQAIEALKHWGPGRMWRIEKTSAEVVKVQLWDCDGIPAGGTDGFDLASTITRALVKAVSDG